MRVLSKIKKFINNIKTASTYQSFGKAKGTHFGYINDLAFINEKDYKFGAIQLVANSIFHFLLVPFTYISVFNAES
jgi:hypothetical protein